MKRILIFGNSGAGKTTLALKLGEKLNLPVHHLDKLWWLPGWKHDTRENFDRKLAGILIGEAWIIDGEYTRTLPERLKYADTAVFLDFPSLLCLYRAVKRIFWWHGKVRQDMAPGCPERFDLPFLIYVWKFRRNFRPKIEAALQEFHGEIIRLKTPAETERFLASVVSEQPRFPKKSAP